MEVDMKRVELCNELLTKLVHKPKDELLAEFGGDSRHDYMLADGTVVTVAMTPAPGGGFPSLSIEMPSECPAQEPVATEPVATEPVATEPVATEPVATEPVFDPMREPDPEPVPEPGPRPERKPKVSYPDAVDCIVSGYSAEMSWRVLQVLTFIGQLEPAKIDRVITYIRKIM